MLKTSLRPANLLSILTLSLALLSSACQAPPPRGPAAQTASATTAATAAANTDTQAANKAVVQRFYEEVVNQKNMAALDEIYAPDFVAHDLGLQTGDLAGVLTGMPDVKATISLWVIEDDLVTAVVTFKGTHKGTMMGIAATGKPVTFGIIDIWRVKDGKLVELWHNVPNSDMLAQISPPAKP